MSGGLIVDAFAGPRGWSEGLRLLGLADVGLELDAAACRTAVAAGHRTIRCDVTRTSLAHLTDVWGVIASPPCKAFSSAGGRDGLEHREALEDAARSGDHEARPSPDPLVWMVLEPIRLVKETKPEWVALEQVPAVLPVWRAMCVWLRSVGYDAEAVGLSAERYGVPQVRRRAFLIASRTRRVQWPAPTHRGYREDGDQGDLFGLPAPVSMADALGWGLSDRPAFTFCGGNTGGPDIAGGSGAREQIREAKASGAWLDTRTGYGDENLTRPVDQPSPSPTLTSKSATGQWAFLNPGVTATQPNRRRRRVDEPAPVVAFGHDMASWCWERPATTVCGDPRIWPPGHKINQADIDRLGEEEARAAFGDRAGTNAVNVTVPEAGVLQSFRPDYPWQGTKSQQAEQVGNAVPPLLAAHVIAAVTGRALEVAA